MRQTPRRTLLAALLLASSAAYADDDTAYPTFKISGFGTADEVHSSNDQVDFLGNILQPAGVGYSRQWSGDPDSRLGVQLDGKFTSNLSGVLQVVSQYDQLNSYIPHIEWANLKYQLTPDWDVRVGRTALPVFMVSDYRLVGYANPWVRPPIEVYNRLPLTHTDGVDTSYRLVTGSVTNTVQAFYGGSAIQTEGGNGGRSGGNWGINDTAAWGDWTLRVGYADFPHLSLYNFQNSEYQGLNAFGTGLLASGYPPFAIPGQQALDLESEYSGYRFSISAATFGISYDPGTWLLLAEYCSSNGTGFFPDSKSGYITAGYHFGKWLPYVSYADVTTSYNGISGINTALLAGTPYAAVAAQLNGGINEIVSYVSPVQKTWTLGVRWDVVSNVDVKLQFDRMNVGGGAYNFYGEFSNQASLPPGTHLGNINVVSLAVDFIF